MPNDCNTFNGEYVWFNVFYSVKSSMRIRPDFTNTGLISGQKINTGKPIPLHTAILLLLVGWWFEIIYKDKLTILSVLFANLGRCLFGLSFKK